MALNPSQESIRNLTDQYTPVTFCEVWKSYCWRIWAWPNKYRRIAQLIAAAAGLPIALILLSVGWRDRHSPGPLSAAHAPWQSNCNACHGSLGSAGDGPNEAGFMHQVDSRKCQTCHAAQPHHASTVGHEANCVTCHREHRGTDHALARPADAHCVRCHRSLPDHVPSINPRFASCVTAFAKGKHPEFGPDKEGAVDPGRLKFNHALHMRPGLRPAHDHKAFGSMLTHDQIPEPARTRYQPKDADPKAAVHLDCASCHQWDSLEVPADVRQLPNDRLPVRGDGAYALPIRYEMHCQACHPLTFDRKDATARLPHRLQPLEVKQHLKNRFVNEYLRDDATLLDRLLPDKRPLQPLPGKHLPPEAVKVVELLEARVKKAEKLIWQEAGGCGKCHYVQGQVDPIVPEKIVRPGIPEVWFEHAKFSHKVHRGLECRACHPDAFALQKDGSANRNASAQAGDILIPGTDTCLQCHDTATTSTQGFTHARGNCTQCHRYHHGDQPLAGRGGAARAPKAPLDLEAFRARP